MLFRSVGDIKFIKAEILFRFQASKARLFEADIIVVVEIIDTANNIAALQKSRCQRRTDKPSNPSHQNLHCFTPEITENTERFIFLTAELN